jgi:ribonucleotide reductase alpha subunit
MEVANLHLEFLPTEYAKKVWTDRYLQSENDEVFKRVAKAVASKDKKLSLTTEEQEAEFLNLFERGLFIGGGRHLCNMGGTGNNMPGNCFALPIKDSREGIYKTLFEMAEIESKGGGVGVNFTSLRPRGAEVKGSKGFASGPCSFIDLYNASISTISQGGSRRGALIAILDISHPDIEEFIHAKKDKNRWNNLNISVAISDAFMYAVYEDAEWDLVFDGTVYKTIKANDLWNQICESAAASGEPGVLFLDTINRYSNLGDVLIEATNPCFTGDMRLLTNLGERPLDRLVGMKNVYGISKDNYEYPIIVEPSGLRECIRLNLTNGRVLELTPEHIIYTTDGKMEAKDTLGRQLDAVDEVSVESIEAIGEQEVFNFSEPVNHVGYINGCLVSNCGELPLLPYGACNLGSLILPNFIVDGKLDTNLLKHSIRMAVLYLDNLLDVSVWPLDKIRETVLDYRILGLGVIGLADLLFLEKMPYGDNADCLNYVSDLISFIYSTALQTSEELAKELGPFPKYNPDVMGYHPRRNAQLMAMAPTGTISALYGASWGIEPYFSQTMIRDERIGKDIVSYQILDKYMKDHTELPDYARFAVGDSNRLSVADHLAVLKEVANHIDGAVSKTVNMPRGSTSDDVDMVYRYMFNNDIKGGTVYVEGSRELEAVKAVSDTIDEDEDDIDDCIELVDLIAEPRPRPEVIEGCTYKVKYCFDKPSIYVTINNYEEEPFEIFFSTKDSVIQEWLDMLARTITALFRRGISCDFLVKDFMQYSSSQCGGRFRGKYIQSASAAIGMVLKEHLRSLGIMPKDVDVEGIKKMAKEDSFGLVCPECFERTLVKQGGCSSCLSCGFSKCE